MCRFIVNFTFYICLFIVYIIFIEKKNRSNLFTFTGEINKIKHWPGFSGWNKEESWEQKQTESSAFLSYIGGFKFISMVTCNPSPDYNHQIVKINSGLVRPSSSTTLFSLKNKYHYSSWICFEMKDFSASSNIRSRMFREMVVI